MPSGSTTPVILPVTVFVEPSITKTVLPSSATYISLLSSLKAMLFRPRPTGMVATTVFVPVDYRDGATTLVCHIISPLSSLKATPNGFVPTGMVATTVFVAPSITETLELS